MFGPDAACETRVVIRGSTIFATPVSWCTSQTIGCSRSGVALVSVALLSSCWVVLYTESLHFPCVCGCPLLVVLRIVSWSFLGGVVVISPKRGSFSALTTFRLSSW